MFECKNIFMHYICLFLTISCVSANDSVDNFTDSYDSNLTFDDSIVYNVHSSDEFLSLADTLATYDNPMLGKNVTINLDSGEVYAFNSGIKDKHLQNRIFDDYGFVMKADGYNLRINGNGATIKNTDEYSLGFLYINRDSTVALNNLTVCDFKLAFVNMGKCCKFL